MTLRDKVWNAVLHRLIEEGRFQISDLEFEEGQRHTVRRVLKEMEEMGWLKRTSDTGKTWYAGDLAEEHLRLSPRAELLADPDFEI